jgi:predicted amidohydrolase
MSSLRVAALQFDIAWEDPEGNFERLGPWIERASAHGADLLLLPEMYACGFSMATERIAEPPDGPSVGFLRERAVAHGLWLGGSVPVRWQDGAKPRNSFLLAGPGGELHRYDKIHPFTYAREHEHYGAGTELVTVEVGGVRLTLFVCYDLRFADEFWATAPGTDAYLVVANWPEARRHHWTALAQARAIENQAYVVAVNRVGQGGKLRYAGDSRIVDPRGGLLASASDQEALLVADIDPAVVSTTRQEFPFLRDRRPIANVR